jgi:hypothetical protein
MPSFSYDQFIPRVRHTMHKLLFDDGCVNATMGTYAIKVNLIS